MLSLESLHRGNSNEYTQHTIFQYIKENQLKSSQLNRYWIFPKELKDELETAVVNEPSVFEPLLFYCMHRNLTLSV